MEKSYLSNPKNQKSDLLTIKEAAEYMRVVPMTVYRLSYDRKLPFTRIGRKILFLRSDIEAYIGKNRVNASF